MSKQYSCYKDSGVEWIGEIPEHWLVKRLKQIAGVETGSTPPKSSEDNFSTEGLSWVKPDDLRGLLPVEGTKEKVSSEGLKYVTVVPAGSVLVCGIGSIGKFGVAKEDVCTNQQINSIIFQAVNPSFGKYLVAASQQELMKHANKVVVSILTKSAQLEVKYPVPSKKEQQAIAVYLDEKTALIDDTIRKKQRLIELLQEERTALINQAVTKGLDPSVPMKDSGVEWLGEVPAHWEVKKLKFFLGSVLGGGTPSTDKPEFWNGPLPWVSPKDMKVPSISSTEDNVTELALLNSSTSLVSSGSVLVVVRSGILKHSLPVAINTVPVTLNQDMKALEGNNALSNLYLFWMLTGCSSLLLTYTKKIGATVDSIDMEAFMNFYVPVPPKVEQDVIVAQLQIKQTDIERVIQRVSDECILLQEYRTALINEVVTGKRCVVPQPELETT